MCIRDRADGLLPALGASSCGHPRNPRDLDSGGPSGFPEMCIRDRYEIEKRTVLASRHDRGGNYRSCECSSLRMDYYRPCLLYTSGVCLRWSVIWVCRYPQTLRPNSQVWLYSLYCCYCLLYTSGMNDAGNYGIPVPDYTDENVSTKVVKIIQSYTTVVNKMVWRKE